MNIGYLFILTSNDAPPYLSKRSSAPQNNLGGAFGFGVFACALMIVTRSIWMAVIFRALSDWGIIFDKVPPILIQEEKWIHGFWQGLVLPVPGVAFMIGCAMLLLWINRGEVPQWLHRLAYKWKLIKPTHKNGVREIHL